MEKEQIVDQMIKEVKKTCTENGLEVLMLVGEDMGDKISAHQFVRISDNMMGALIYDLIEDDPHLAGFFLIFLLVNIPFNFIYCLFYTFQ